MQRWGLKRGGRHTNEQKERQLEEKHMLRGNLWQDEEVTAKYTAGREAAADQ